MKCPRPFGRGHFYLKGAKVADFAELIASLVNPGEDGPSETIYDDLTASYQDATTTRDAVIGERDALIAELQSEVTRLKVQNYELLTAAPANDPGEPGDDSDDADDADGDDGDDIGDIDDMFEKKGD